MRRFLSFFFALAVTVGVSASAFGTSMMLTGAGKSGGGGGGSSPMSIVTVNAAKQYLTTTWSHAPTDPKKATIAYWYKFTAPGSLAPANYLFTTAATGGVLFDHLYNNSQLHYQINDDGGGSTYLITDGGSDSPDSNWHHICLQIDTTQATAANRVVIWIDGVNVGTSGSPTFPSLNEDMGVTANTIKSYIAEVDYLVGGSTGIPDAKFAYVYLIDGQALPASSFTTGTGAGSIHPITYSGTYGNNGFFLNGSGSTLNDQSGNANNWTAPNGISFSSDLPT